MREPAPGSRFLPALEGEAVGPVPDMTPMYSSDHVPSTIHCQKPSSETKPQKCDIRREYHVHRYRHNSCIGVGLGPTSAEHFNNVDKCGRGTQVK